MKKLYGLLIIGAALVVQVSAQGLCPYIGPDIQLPCGTNTTTLTADFTNCPPGGPNPLNTTSYGLTNITFAPSPNAGTVIPLGDDQVSGAYPIGFSFCFFGNTYTNFYCGSNGWISFSAGQSASWNCSTIPIPSVNACVPKNCIMGPYFDFNPGAGGQIRYQTQGVAPCRKLVVSWVNVPSYSCGGANNIQIVIYESTNIIECHITNKNNCPGWNSGAGTEGLHNLAGSVAITVPGRNASAWTTTNNAYRWTPSGAPVAPTYNWYQVGNPVPIGTGLTINVTPPAGGASYTCHVDYGACYNGYMTCMGFVGANGPDTITVIPGPPNIFPSIPGPYDFCPGQTITVGTDQPYSTYLWSDGSTGPTYTSGTPGPISVDVIDANGCTGTANAVLNMWPAPNVTVLPVNPGICPGGSVQMTANGAQTYVWTPATGLDNPNSNVVNANPASTITYSIVGTDVNGCVDSTTNTVTVFPAPSVTATATDPGVCPGYGTTLNAVGSVNYVWSPAATVSTPNAASSAAYPVATTTYTVNATDANGCTATDNVTVLLYDEPVVAFSAPIVNGCAPVTVNLQNNSNIASGTITIYNWFVEGQGSSGAQNPSFTFNTPGAYDVTLVAISDMGCIDSLSIVDYINIYSVPTADFFATPQPADLNTVVSFTNTSSLDAVNFLWDFDGLGSSVASSPSFQFSYADTFMVTLYVSTIYGCADTVQHPIIVQDVSEIWIPNSFTPGNQDGLNDIWFPVGRNLNKTIITIDVEVFDRWGISVFKSNTSDKPWIGKVSGTNNDCPQDVYVYRVYFKNEKGDDFTYFGHVSLIR